ncbi:uncharacterized protein MYCFIDRAFT_175136 [Pseudocercospora fijiensis CIRAD86]|uniref:Uncharacterized protein n=1 Tax=Pseudocercospora fijiensis (strain CIRAD86) TaxID=383855 RepID=M3AGM7_PSEFD|nr:uncharacterized protein MYCFIDRAFT_175136 [Pseudocercospora fijiensis CIRAD86]EME83716.1 hypothetical protein MYCFIDRAFT_175136 [Pseudocercospora fijiensis CIRAD86]
MNEMRHGLVLQRGLDSGLIQGERRVDFISVRGVFPGEQQCRRYNGSESTEIAIHCLKRSSSATVIWAGILSEPRACANTSKKEHRTQYYSSEVRKLVTGLLCLAGPLLRAERRAGATPSEHTPQPFVYIEPFSFLLLIFEGQGCFAGEQRRSAGRKSPLLLPGCANISRWLQETSKTHSWLLAGLLLLSALRRRVQRKSKHVRQALGELQDPLNTPRGAHDASSGRSIAVDTCPPPPFQASPSLLHYARRQEPACKARQGKASTDGPQYPLLSLSLFYTTHHEPSPNPDHEPKLFLLRFLLRSQRRIHPVSGPSTITLPSTASPQRKSHCVHITFRPQKLSCPHFIDPTPFLPPQTPTSSQRILIHLQVFASQVTHPRRHVGGVFFSGFWNFHVLQVGLEVEGGGWSVEKFWYEEVEKRRLAENLTCMFRWKANHLVHAPPIPQTVNVSRLGANILADLAARLQKQFHDHLLWMAKLWICQVFQPILLYLSASQNTEGDSMKVTDMLYLCRSSFSQKSKLLCVNFVGRLNHFCLLRHPSRLCSILLTPLSFRAILDFHKHHPQPKSCIDPLDLRSRALALGVELQPIDDRVLGRWVIAGLPLLISEARVRLGGTASDHDRVQCHIVARGVGDSRTDIQNPKCPVLQYGSVSGHDLRQYLQSYPRFRDEQRKRKDCRRRPARIKLLDIAGVQSRIFVMRCRIGMSLKKDDEVCDGGSDLLDGRGLKEPAGQLMCVPHATPLTSQPTGPYHMRLLSASVDDVGRPTLIPHSAPLRRVRWQERRPGEWCTYHMRASEDKCDGGVVVGTLRAIAVKAITCSPMGLWYMGEMNYAALDNRYRHDGESGKVELTMAASGPTKRFPQYISTGELVVLGRKPSSR